VRLSDPQRTDGRDPRLEAVLNAPDAPEATLTCRRCGETLPARWWACGDVSCPMKDEA
jgi:hypothetical protein